MRRRAALPDEHSLGEAIRRGEQASAIMDSPIFREAVERAAENLYEFWLSSNKIEDREAAWSKTHALEAVENELRGIVSDGEVAASQAE